MSVAQRCLFNVKAQSFIKRLASTQAELPSYKVVVIGGGAGGLAVSSTISEVLGRNSVAIIEPSDVHYYQPQWTFVGAGLKTLADSAKPTEKLIPQNANWIKNHVTKVEPEANTVVLGDGSKVKYDFLVVAPGIQMNWNKIKGLQESIGKNGVASIYSKDTVEKTWDFLKGFRGGNAIFTMPNTPIKCPGAAIKIAYLSEDYLTKSRVRARSKVLYNSAMGKIFSIEKYADSLTRIAKERDIQVNLLTELTEVRGDKKEAVFKNAKTGEEQIYNFELLHVVPPMGAPPFIADSKIGNAAGWVDVDQNTLQHKKYHNIFSLGDASGCPTSKTAAAVAAQSGVLKKNLLTAINEGPGSVGVARYDGYASCPLVVGQDKVVLAEFSGYTTKPMETFPFDQGKESSSMYYLTKEVLPEIYWNRLLKGTWEGPHRFRKWFSYLG